MVWFYSWITIIIFYFYFSIVFGMRSSSGTLRYYRPSIHPFQDFIVVVVVVVVSTASALTSFRASHFVSQRSSIKTLPQALCACLLTAAIDMSNCGRRRIHVQCTFVHSSTLIHNWSSRSNLCLRQQRKMVMKTNKFKYMYNIQIHLTSIIYQPFLCVLVFIFIVSVCDSHSLSSVLCVRLAWNYPRVFDMAASERTIEIVEYIQMYQRMGKSHRISPCVWYTFLEIQIEHKNIMNLSHFLNDHLAFFLSPPIVVHCFLSAERWICLSCWWLLAGWEWEWAHHAGFYLRWHPQARL